MINGLITDYRSKESISIKHIRLIGVISVHIIHKKIINQKWFKAIIKTLL